ncbi:MAG: hypothetical protein COV65_04900 [Nitrosopumilales archaeon CG11_big_fil_rev_8_21_14_0_20_33_24]|nr:MAG: hypothetical protein COV65_04900 [Nitrosopumilales archaeon CG11_big_fil_rev_8_21_14_0_20_33_24]PIY89056.1 MAG: hypothetical protein COY74_06845 [Nitrosopumilales archaeon CG_4_10_14_0_8_um_filter_34_8]PJB98476.1 MAG: hypothetical protein CO079_02170 [Nitrosopumilales archaeon CG_4_9_14_0_8_um_filter_34_10]
MATRLVYVVFVLPIVISIAFGTVVMADVLQSPDRELNMWPMGNHNIMTNDESISIIGLEKQYSISTPIQIQVKVDDSQFDCGDLYVTVYSGKQTVVTQSGFLQQCFDTNNSLLPIDDTFSEIIDKPGQYDLVVKMIDQNQKSSISASGKFTIK